MTAPWPPFEVFILACERVQRGRRSGPTSADADERFNLQRWRRDYDRARDELGLAPRDDIWTRASRWWQESNVPRRAVSAGGGAALVPVLAGLVGLSGYRILLAALMVFLGCFAWPPATQTRLRNPSGLLAAAGVILGVMLLVDAARQEQDSTGASTAATQSPADPRRSAGLGRPTIPIERYIHEGGGRPAEVPEENGLFGISLGAPAQPALDSLGDERERYPGDPEGSLVREWDRGSLTISMEVDAVQSVSSVAVTRFGARDDDPWRAALPQGLVLGAATLDDVLRTRGAPHDVSLQFTEGWDLTVSYQQGPEGTHAASYSVLLDPTSNITLDSENPGSESNLRKLRRYKLGAYSISYASE